MKSTTACVPSFPMTRRICFVAPFLIPIFMLNVPSTSALEIVGNFLTAGESFPGIDNEFAAAPPENLVGGGSLTGLFEAAAEIWETAILDDHTVTINYGWTDGLNFGRALETLVHETTSMPIRQTESTIRFGARGEQEFSIFMDPTPHDSSEFTTFDVSHRDLGAGTINSERMFRDAIGSAQGAGDLFTGMIHEIGHALGLDFDNTAFQLANVDDGIVVQWPRPLAGSRLATRSSHLKPESVLMGASPLSLGTRSYPTEVDILAVAEVGQFEQVNLSPIGLPSPTKRGPGQFVDVIGDGDDLGVLLSPRGLVFGPNGDLFVQNAGSDPFRRIERFSGVTHESLGTFAEADDAHHWSVGAEHTFQFGPDGSLYVIGSIGAAGATVPSVLRYDGKTGQFIDDLAVGIDANAIAFGPSGELFIASHREEQVLQFDWRTGEQIGSIEYDPGPLDILNGPDEELYVRSILSTDDGPRAVLWKGNGELFIDDLNEGAPGPPFATKGIEFGPDGNLYVVSDRGSQQNVRVFDDITGDFLGQYVPSYLGGLGDGSGIAFGPNRNLYVSSSRNNEVIVFRGPQVVPEPRAYVLSLLAILFTLPLRHRSRCDSCKVCFWLNAWHHLNDGRG